MAHCAHILAPSCAWAATAEPRLNRSFKSRLGDAIRALRPRSSKSTEESRTLCTLNVDSLTELDLSDRLKSRWGDDDTSTRLGSNASSSSLEEVTSLPGSVEETLTPKEMPSSASSHAVADEEEYDQRSFEIASTGASRCRIRGPQSKRNELHQMVLLLCRKASSKYAGRVYQDVRNAFIAVDSSDNGKIGPGEVATFCKHFDLTPEIATRFFSLLEDPREKGVAHWPSFLAEYMPTFLAKSDWRLSPDEGRPQPALK